MSDLPAYATVQKALEGAEALTSAAESHGLLTGLFCSGKIKQVDAVQWAESSLALRKENKPEDVKALLALYRVTEQKLEDMDFSFELLLPDDNVMLCTRADELGMWCQGFMNGLRLGDVNFAAAYSEDCREALHRIEEIAGIEYTNVGYEEEDEVTFFEVVEYIRLGVLIIYTEIAKKMKYDTAHGGAGGHLH